jgi:inhibitor of KinA
LSVKSKFDVQSLGDSALIVEWRGFGPSEALSTVHAAVAALSQASPPGFIEAVPGFQSVAVYFDPMKAGLDELRAAVAKILSRLSVPEATTARQIQIPVCYEAEFGLDLERISQHSSLSIEKIIELHSSADYTVQLIGFVPGFCYLAGLPKSLEVPRLSSPRVRVPAGSVGIGQDQTGVYPIEIPGGWNLVGRTPMRLFSPESQPPALLQPGDSVRFFRISLEEYNRRRGES